MKNWEEIKNHLIFNDSQMLNLINHYGEPNMLDNFDKSNLFDSLINSIISQQLSTRVASVIKSRLYSLEAFKIMPGLGFLYLQLFVEQ